MLSMRVSKISKSEKLYFLETKMRDELKFSLLFNFRLYTKHPHRVFYILEPEKYDKLLILINNVCFSLISIISYFYFS